MKKKLLFSYALLGALICFSSSAHAGPRLVERLIDNISSSGLDALKARLESPKGEVVKVKDGVCYIINESGVILKKGSVLSIVRAGEKIIHPVTGEELGVITEPVGKVRVTSSDKKLIYAVVAAGADKIKRGDTIATPDAKPRVALVMSLSLVSWEPEAVTRELGQKLGQWKGLDWVEQYAVERFIFDENLSKRSDIINRKSFKNLSVRLKADYLIFLDVQEKDGSALTSISLYKLDGGLEPLAMRRGIAVVTTSKRAAASIRQEPEPEAPKEAPLSKKLSVPQKQAVEQPQMTKSTPPAKPAPAPGKTERAAGILGGYKTKMLGEFGESIAALLTYDLDGDGVKEIVIGFDHKVAVFKWNGEKLEPVWEKELGHRNQILGLGAGDFNANGEAEIYINNATFSRIQSLIIERKNGSYTVIRDKTPMFFYAGSDGKLYGREQKTNFQLKDKIVELTWREDGFEKKPFITLPAGRWMTGLGFFDLDGDGVTDIAGYDNYLKLRYYTSKKQRWKKLSGRFGGSNVKIKLYEEDGVEIFQEFLTPTLLFTDSSGTPMIVALSNKSSISLVADRAFTKAQVVVIEYDGSAFVEKTRTPIAEGAIQGATMFDQVDSSLKLLLVSRSYLSFFGKSRSELILLDLNSY